MNSIASNASHPGPAVRGRLAPSPTGHLHLGNAWSFLLCWLAVRAAGGRLALRMEDIDPERSRPHFVQDIMRDLAWLGLDWDEGPDVGGPFAPYTQSARLERYAHVIERLSGMGRTYPCFCTRKELRTMASAPHLEDAGPTYPGTCLGLDAAQCREREALGRRPALRLRGDGEARFNDLVHGEIRLGWAECGGDFPLRRSDGVISYQLAVAVDDMDQHISLVVRGADILPCTPRQILLFTLLGGAAPQYAHVPLLLDHEGVRLAKRHQACELRALRERGVSARAVVGHLAFLAGLLPASAPASAADLPGLFAWEKIPRTPMKLAQGIEDVLLDLS